nr:Ger(x)C family spore germination protein [Bacillus sp. FJAT-50079]
MLLLLLTACWDRVETNDLAIITATGIDKADDGQIELSVQIFIPKAPVSGSEGMGPTSNGRTTMVMSHKGVSLADALSKLQAELSRKVFWGLCKVFIFGEEIAVDGIQDHLDFLLRHPEPRERAFIFVSNGKAKKYLKLNADLERYSAEYVREIASKRHGMGVSLKDLDEMLSNEDRSAVLPYLKEVNESKKFMKVIGTAMFKKDQMIGIISEATTRGLLWLRNEIEDYTTIVQLDNQGEVAIFPVKTDIKLIPEIKGNDWKMIVKINAEGSIVQNTTYLNLSNQASLEKIEKAFQEKLQKRIGSAIEESKKLQVDVVHFGKEFHRKYPKQWKKVEPRWEEKFPEVKVEYIIKTNIKREGYINRPVKER